MHRNWMCYQLFLLNLALRHRQCHHHKHPRYHHRQSPFDLDLICRDNYQNHRLLRLSHYLFHCQGLPIQLIPTSYLSNLYLQYLSESLRLSSIEYLHLKKGRQLQIELVLEKYSS